MLGALGVLDPCVDEDHPSLSSDSLRRQSIGIGDYGEPNLKCADIPQLTHSGFGGLTPIRATLT